MEVSQLPDKDLGISDHLCLIKIARFITAGSLSLVRWNKLCSSDSFMGNLVQKLAGRQADPDRAARGVDARSGEQSSGLMANVCIVISIRINKPSLGYR